MNHLDSVSNRDEDIIGSATSEDIVSALAKCGCKDLPSAIRGLEPHQASSTRTPIGFAEVEVPAQQAQQQAVRRAAAAALSLTIVKLVPVINPLRPRPQPPPKQKRQRTKVLQPPPLPKRIFRARAGESMPSVSTGLKPEEASAAWAEFGDNAPEGPTSPGGGPANEGGGEDGQEAMLRRVLGKEGAESAEGLYANMIDGAWHCSNCGCPESISVGRRKGPLGQGTMCGECGKYWLKYRERRPVEYNTSIDHHLNLKKVAKAKNRGNKGNINANPSPSKTSSAREEAPAARAQNTLPQANSTSLAPLVFWSPVQAHTQDN